MRFTYVRQSCRHGTDQPFCCVVLSAAPPVHRLSLHVGPLAVVGGRKTDRGMFIRVLAKLL